MLRAQHGEDVLHQLAQQADAEQKRDAGQNAPGLTASRPEAAGRRRGSAAGIGMVWVDIGRASVAAQISRRAMRLRPGLRS